LTDARLPSRRRAGHPLSWIGHIRGCLRQLRRVTIAPLWLALDTAYSVSGTALARAFLVAPESFINLSSSLYTVECVCAQRDAGSAGVRDCVALPGLPPGRRDGRVGAHRVLPQVEGEVPRAAGRDRCHARLHQGGCQHPLSLQGAAQMSKRVGWGWPFSWVAGRSPSLTDRPIPCGRGVFGPRHVASAPFSFHVQRKRREGRLTR